MNELETSKLLSVLPSDYVVIDIETTGLNPGQDEIIEISGIKVIDNKIISKFTSLVKPVKKVSDFITNLTGITNSMLRESPSIDKVINDFHDFVNDSVIMGHNVSFDVSFIRKSLKLENKNFNNNYIDTMRISRHLLKELKHHRLSDLANYYGISTEGNHRSLKDCEINYEVYNKLLNEAANQYGSISAFEERLLSKRYYSYSKLIIETDNTEFDEAHPLYKKTCVFTGTLEKMSRNEAMQKVVDLGGLCSNNVNVDTNYVILANNTYSPFMKGPKSKKHEAAEELILKGYNIEILSEEEFYKIIEVTVTH